MVARSFAILMTSYALLGDDVDVTGNRSNHIVTGHPVRANFFFGRTFDLVSESNLLLLTLLALAIRCHAYSSVYTSTTLCFSERFSARSAVLVYQLSVLVSLGQIWLRETRLSLYRSLRFPV